MLSQDDAKALVTTIWNESRWAELNRLERIDEAMRPPPLLRPGETSRMAYGRRGAAPVTIPQDAPDVMYELARKAETNYLPLLVRTFRQALRVVGYLSEAPPEQNPWKWWQKNRLDARQVGIVDSALKYGVAYALVTEGEVAPGEMGPVVRAFTPRTMTAVYEDTELDEWPVAAAYLDGPRNEFLVLVDSTHEYRFRLPEEPTAGAFGLPSGSLVPLRSGVADVELAGTREHGAQFGRTPVVRFRDSYLLDGEEQMGIIEPLLVLQDRINETSFGQLVAQHFAAFRQRAVLGWVPQTEAEEWRAGAARVWYLDVDPQDVRIQDMPETDLVRYIESGKAARRDLAAMAQLPVQTLGTDGISNISDATLAGLDKAKNERAREIALALGESYEQMMRAMAHIAGDYEAAADQYAEVRWAERETRTWAATVDGLVKLVQAQVMTANTALEMVPGMTDQQVESARDDVRRERAGSAVEALRAFAAGNRVSADDADSA